MNRIKWLAGFLALLVCLSGCGGTHQSGGSYNIYLIAKSSTTEFWKAVFSGANAAKSEYNVQLTILAPDTEEDFEAQNDYIRQAVADGADAIVFSAISYTENAAAIDEAVAAGVRVVVFDSDVDSKGGSVRIGTDNVAGLMRIQSSLSIAEVNYDFEQGGLRNVTDGAEVNAFGVRSESYRRWNRLSFYGKLSYDYAASKDRSWAGNANIGDSPMLSGDSIPGNTRDETYAIEAGVAYRMGRWVVGAMWKYEDRSLAKRRDSRNKTTSMYLSVQPGVMFTSKVVDAGLNFTYERSTEQVGYAAFGTNTTSGMIYFFEGMWFYTSQQLGGSEKFYDVYYKGSEYGGAAQLE